MDFSPTDLLNVPQDIADMIRAIVRNNGMTADEIATKFGMSPEQAREKLDGLVEKGMLRAIFENETVFYKVCFRKKTAKKTSDKLLRIFDDP